MPSGTPSRPLALPFGSQNQGSVMRIGRSGRPEVNETEARQGFLDRPILVVLAVSLVLVIAAFLVLPKLV